MTASRQKTLAVVKAVRAHVLLLLVLVLLLISYAVFVCAVGFNLTAKQSGQWKN